MKRDLAEALRRDDLWVDADAPCEVLDTVRPVPGAEVVLILLPAGAPMQALVLSSYDSHVDDDRIDAYVPLSFGPVPPLPVYCREALCQHCRTYVAADSLVRVEAWPLAWACEPCAAELRADEDDPRTGEPDVCDRCEGGGCRACLAVAGWNGRPRKP